MTNSTIWLIIFFITLVVEAITAGLVSVWFSVGALASFIVSYITDNIIIEIIVFVIVSAISLIATRPIIKKYFNKDITKTNCEKLIGKTGVVQKDISDKDMGTIKVDGQIWSALNKDKGVIESNTEVEVLSIEGVKLIVRKKDN